MVGLWVEVGARFWHRGAQLKTLKIKNAALITVKNNDYNRLTDCHDNHVGKTVKKLRLSVDYNIMGKMKME